MTQRLVIPATIGKVEERFTTHWVSGVGADAVTEQRSTGWWVVIDQIAMFVGPDKPDFQQGEMVKLCIEKTTPSEPQPVDQPKKPAPQAGDLTDVISRSSI